MPDKPKDPIDHALERNDPRPLTQLDLQDLEKLRIAEQILEARFHAQKRASRLAVVSSALVGYVALAGFFANAYQNYLNKEHLKEQADHEEAKWKQEFARGEKADKFKAFFQNSELVTDQSNPERRLIGYALMDDYVSDPDYHAKAVAILEQALNRELAEDDDNEENTGIEDRHHAAVSQIVQAMSASTSCREFERAARSIQGIVHHAKKAELPEIREFFSLYARRLVGRAALVCRDTQDFDDVREPLRQGLKRVPDVASLTKNATKADGNAALARMLVDACVDEQQDLGSQECLDIRKKYGALCKTAQTKPAAWKEEQKACEIIATWPETSAPQTAAVPTAE